MCDQNKLHLEYPSIPFIMPPFGHYIRGSRSHLVPLPQPVSTQGKSTQQQNIHAWPTSADLGSQGLGCKIVVQRLGSGCSPTCGTLPHYRAPEPVLQLKPKHLHCNFTVSQPKPTNLGQPWVFYCRVLISGMTWLHISYLTAALKHPCLSLSTLCLQKAFVRTTYLFGPCILSQDLAFIILLSGQKKRVTLKQHNSCCASFSTSFIFFLLYLVLHICGFYQFC